MAKTRGPSHKAYYTRAAKEMIAIKNRRRKLTKMLKTQPNNLQVVEALKNVSYRRKTPSVTHRSKIECRAANMMRLAQSKDGIKAVRTNEKKMFSLGERAHFNGELIWSNI